MKRAGCIFIFFLLLLMGCLEGKPIFRLEGEWEGIGPDGGDMHFVYITSNHILFASHGFGGIWRSTDRGENWQFIENEEWIDTNFMAMDECNDSIIGGGNNGLWISDDGIKWDKIVTGNRGIDDGEYEVISIVALSTSHILFSVRGLKSSSPHGFFELVDGKLNFYELPEKATNAIVMLAYGKINGINMVFVSSSQRGLYTYEMSRKKWDKILNERTTRVFVKNGKVYTGTIGNWYFIGEYDSNTRQWRWEHVTVDKKCGIASFIVPDPYTPNWLWIGATGKGHIYPVNGGVSFVACGYYDGKWEEIHFKSNYATMIAIDKNATGESDAEYTVETKYGKIAKYAFVPQGGSGCIQRTRNGGLTWERAYNGIYGDTINKINLLHGVREGDILVSCVSGNQITDDMGDTWEEGIDFTLGDIGYGLPGYSWGAASPDEKLEEKYDLLIATGYPPENFTGNGVYAIDTHNIKRIKRIFAFPCFDLVINGNFLYVGRMDRDASIINLQTMEIENISIPNGEAGINIRIYDGVPYISTIMGGNKNSDHYFFSDKNAMGGLYIYDGERCREIYHGKRIISFSANGKSIYALTCDGKLLYFKNNELKWQVTLPPATYSDMAVDWEKRIIYVSTFDDSTDGVLYANFYSARLGKFYVLGGLPTKRVRCLLLVNGWLFAGTEGHSVWRIHPEKKWMNGNLYRHLFIFYHNLHAWQTKSM